MARKQHNTEAGYIAERMNPHVPGRKVVIYIAAEQGIDAFADREGNPHKYAVVCDQHGQIGGTTNLPKARELMKAPEDFCTGCRGTVWPE